MKFRKQGKLRVPTTPYDTELVITGIVFKSYDKNAGAIEFHIANQDGTPADLIGSTVRLFMKIFREDEEQPFPVFDNEVVVESYVEGIVVYQVPDMLLAYTGLVEANLYIDWAEDDAHTDNIAFTFNIDKSEIDAEIEANGNYYFKDFLQLLDAVKQEATDAVLEMNDTIEETVNEINEKLDSISDDVEAIDFGSVQKLKLTADDGKAMRLVTLDPRPETIDELTRPGYYYITTTESNTFIPEDSFLNETGVSGAGWVTVYPGDTGGSVIQEWSRNTSDVTINARHLYRKQAGTDPVEWGEWTEYAQSTSAMLSSVNYRGAAYTISEAVLDGAQVTSYVNLAKCSGHYYLTDADSDGMDDWEDLPFEVENGIFVTNIPNDKKTHFTQLITNDLVDSPEKYWRIVQIASTDIVTDWYKIITQDDAQLYKLTNDDGSSFKIEDLEIAPESLEQWARMYKGFFYLANVTLVEMSDFDELPEEFADSHVHMMIQSGTNSNYALQTLTQYQSPYMQIYRIVTSTSKGHWKFVVTTEDLDTSSLNDRLTALEEYVDESNNTHLEWGTVDFSTEELTISFENVYQSPPSVTISITGSSSASYVYDYIKTDETYTGITLTATGEGTYIQIQVIGRV